MKKIILVKFILILIFGTVSAQNTYYKSTHELIPYRVGDLWGYKSSWKDSIVVKPQYEDADLFSSNGLARAKSNGLFGFINRSGRLQIPCKYEYAGIFYSSQTSYPKEMVYIGNNRYLHKEGQILNLKNEPEPDELVLSGYNLFPSPLRISKTEYVQGFIYSIDSLTKKFVKVKKSFPDSIDVDVFDPFKKELVVKKNGKMGVTDFDGNQIIPFIYDAIYKQSEFDNYYYSGLNGYFLRKNGLTGYIDFANQINIPPIYTKIVRFDLNVAEVVTRTGKKGFIDLKNGTEYFEE